MIMKGFVSRDMKDRDCNCSKPNILDDGKCLYKGRCRQSCVIYQVKCKCCKKVYIGNTQKFLKTRIQQHIYDVVCLYNDNTKSDSFASHFNEHLKRQNLPTIKSKDVRPLLDVSIIKKTDPIIVSKKFGRDECQLCMNERIEITSRWLKSGVSKLINKNIEIYGACRHKACFHVFEQVKNLPGTDEGINPEKEAE